jgi:hypothetical protein
MQEYDCSSNRSAPRPVTRISSRPTLGSCSQAGWPRSASWWRRTVTCPGRLRQSAPPDTPRSGFSAAHAWVVGHGQNAMLSRAIGTSENVSPRRMNCAVPVVPRLRTDLNSVEKLRSIVRALALAPGPRNASGSSIALRPRSRWSWRPCISVRGVRSWPRCGRSSRRTYAAPHVAGGPGEPRGPRAPPWPRTQPAGSAGLSQPRVIVTCRWYQAPSRSVVRDTAV